MGSNPVSPTSRLTMQNIEWIEINLPWYISCYWENMPPEPNLEVREQEIFGISLKAFEIANEKSLEEYSKLLGDLRLLQDEARALSYREGDHDFYLSPAYSQIAEKFWQQHQQDDCVVTNNAYSELSEKIFAWTDQQPEWKTYQQDKEDFLKIEKQKSFSGRGLAKPGTIIEMEDGSIELIGSINAAAGQCNDCQAFDNDAIVTRYAVVYPFVRKEAREHDTNE